MPQKTITSNKKSSKEISPYEIEEYYLNIYDRKYRKPTDAATMMHIRCKNVDPVTKRKISQLGLQDLNRYKGWGNNFHDGFKDLNPDMNPSYKFQRKGKNK